MGREDTSFHATLYHDDGGGFVEVVVVVARRCRYLLVNTFARGLLITDSNDDDRR